MCGKSLMFHFNAWKNKRTVTQRTKSEGQPDLQQPAVMVTNSALTGQWQSFPRAEEVPEGAFLPSDCLPEPQGQVGVWRAAEKGDPCCGCNLTKAE